VGHKGTEELELLKGLKFGITSKETALRRGRGFSVLLVDRTTGAVQIQIHLRVAYLFHLWEEAMVDVEVDLAAEDVLVDMCGGQVLNTRFVRTSVGVEDRGSEANVEPDEELELGVLLSLDSSLQRSNEVFLCHLVERGLRRQRGLVAESPGDGERVHTVALRVEDEAREDLSASWGTTGHEVLLV